MAYIVPKEVYSFYSLPTGKAQYTAFREMKKFVNGKLIKVQKQTNLLTPEKEDRYVYRLIDLLKPTFSKRGNIIHYSNVDEYAPLDDVRILRKIYRKCIG
jgi:hypothetical protein